MWGFSYLVNHIHCHFLKLLSNGVKKHYVASWSMTYVLLLYSSFTEPEINTHIPSITRLITFYNTVLFYDHVLPPW